MVEAELVYGSPFQLLVAVVLSAQCTDKRVNAITPKLFRDYYAEVWLASEGGCYLSTFAHVATPAKQAPGGLGQNAGGGSTMGVAPEDPKELVKLPGVAENGQRGAERLLQPTPHSSGYTRVPSDKADRAGNRSTSYATEVRQLLSTFTYEYTDVPCNKALHGKSTSNNPQT